MQENQRDQVREHHDAVEHITHIPNEFDLAQCAEHDKGEHEHAINIQSRGRAEKEADIRLAEVVPADDRSEGEEREASRDDHRTDFTEGGVKCFLRDERAVEAELIRAG